jgi:hypothetical protein
LYFTHKLKQNPINQYSRLSERILNYRILLTS